MKFVINSKQLSDKLQKLGKVINPKSTLPILGCFLFGIKGSKLFLVASDTENRMTSSLDIQSVEGEGKIAIESPMILNALKELPEQPITFEINNDNLEVFIHYHNGKYNFIGQSGDEYPEPRPLDEKVKQEITIDSDVLFKGISGTLFAAATDELRPVMEAVFIDITTDSVTFVASDGHKLIKITNTNTKGKSPASFLLSKKAATIMLKLLSKDKYSIGIKFDYNNVRFDLCDYIITSRSIEGRYPNYNSVIPSTNDKRFHICKDSFIGIIKRVCVFSNQSSNLIKAKICNNKLTIKGQDIDFSTAAEESIVIEYNGDPINIGFKASFLLEILNSLSSDEVEIKLSEPNKAALILPTSKLADFEHLSLLMPISLLE